ncbi:MULTISPECIES: hypothetical protein [unclassified Streptomyces]|uniref:hypothetical protein n=1 Tax=unclassified Streptomyces TaxID=2593676 RepID=UPI00324C4D13
MDDRRARAYAAEGAVWSRLAALLPTAEDVDEVQACWDIGEQEGGLDALVGRLLELGLPIGGLERAELAVMAGQWGMWDPLGARIVACAGEPGLLRVFEDGARKTLDVRSVVPGRPSAGSVLVPWIGCVGCGVCLGRVHTREKWGGLSFVAESYVVFGTERPPEPRVFDREEHGAVWSALDAVRGGCACR